MKFKRFNLNFTETMYSVVLNVLEIFLLVKIINWLHDALELKDVPNFAALCIITISFCKTLFSSLNLDDKKDTAQEKIIKITSRTIYLLVHFALFYLFLFYFQH